MRKFFLHIFPLLAWMGVIYFASSQPYEQQDLRPFLRELDLSWVKTFFSWVDFTYSSTPISIENRGVEAFVEFFIRKGAHVTVFFVLGFLAYRMLRNIFQKKGISIGLTFFIIFLFAALDEYRHLLHPNRTGLFQDVMLDVFGGTIGLLLAVLVYRKKDRKIDVKRQ